MGQVTLAEFRTDLRYDLLDRDDVTADWLDRRVNAAYVHVCNPGVYMHREVQTTEDFQLVLNQSVYPIDPTTIGYQIIAIVNMYYYSSAVPTDTTEKNKIYPRHIDWFGRRTLSSGSTPNSFAVYGEDLHIHPVPDANAAGNVARALVWREPARLTVNTQVTVIPSNWDEVIQLGARWRGERDLGYRDKAELTKQDYAALLNEYIERQDLEAQGIGWEVEVNHGSSVMEM